MRNTTISRGKVKEIIDEIPGEKLAGVLDFLEYVRDKEEWEATWEILKDRKFVERVKKGKKDIVEGRWQKWGEVKRNA